TITSNTLQTDKNIKTLSQLQTSVDENLTNIQTGLTDLYGQNNVLSLRMDDIEDDVLVLQTEANAQADILTDIEDRMEDIELTHSELMDFFIAINPDTLVYTDDQGNLTIEGVMSVVKLVAGEIETEKLTIANNENETIGVTTFCPVNYKLVGVECTEDTSEDNENDGKNVFVESDIIDETTTIFTTFENNPGTSNWVEKSKDENGEFNGFTINLEDAVEKAVKVNWWIVEKMAGN
ncbi:MAG: hypothetical protein U9Q12_04110, partial [Patescibacteria group bacterium]|nr:hypothetical protein [Patescibacteria group bacterium]